MIGTRGLFFYLVLSGCCELRYLAHCGLLSPRYWHDCANILGKLILWWFYCVLLDKRTKTKPQSPLQWVWGSQKKYIWLTRLNSPAARGQPYSRLGLLSVLMWTDNAFNLSKKKCVLSYRKFEYPRRFQTIASLKPEKSTLDVGKCIKSSAFPVLFRRREFRQKCFSCESKFAAFSCHWLKFELAGQSDGR